MAMRSVPRLVKLGSLATPAEASTSPDKARDLFREVARCLPWVVNNYKLEEITSVQELRRNCAKLFKLNANLRNPGTVDVLVYKGREELEMVLLQHKQRHHLIADYLTKPQQLLKRQNQDSPFLQTFFAGNQPLVQPLGHTTQGV
jgi:NADH dehydrogenase (ubiquinone) 1 alpha subcomplex subunit 6